MEYSGTSDSDKQWCIGPVVVKREGRGLALSLFIVMHHELPFACGIIESNILVRKQVAVRKRTSFAAFHDTRRPPARSELPNLRFQVPALAASNRVDRGSGDLSESVAMSSFERPVGRNTGAPGSVLHGILASLPNRYLPPSGAPPTARSRNLSRPAVSSLSLVCIPTPKRYISVGLVRTVTPHGENHANLFRNQHTHIRRVPRPLVFITAPFVEPLVSTPC